MKSQLLILFILSTLMFFNFNIEQNEFINLNSVKNDVQLSPDSITNFNIIIEEIGGLERVKPSFCGTDGQLVGNGRATIKGVGEFDVIFIQCTDLVAGNYIKGFYDDGEQNSLYFRSEETAYDENGKYYTYNFYEGTGKFKEVSGVIKVYSNEILNGTIGNYSRTSQGVLELR